MGKFLKVAGYTLGGTALFAAGIMAENKFGLTKKATDLVGGINKKDVSSNEDASKVAADAVKAAQTKVINPNPQKA